jgi:hypothetical protein
MDANFVGPHMRRAELCSGLGPTRKKKQKKELKSRFEFTIQNVLFLKNVIKRLVKLQLAF